MTGANSYNNSNRDVALDGMTKFEVADKAIYLLTVYLLKIGQKAERFVINNGGVLILISCWWNIM